MVRRALVLLVAASSCVGGPGHEPGSPAGAPGRQTTVDPNDIDDDPVPGADASPDAEPAPGPVPAPESDAVDVEPDIPHVVNPVLADLAFATIREIYPNVTESLDKPEFVGALSASCQRASAGEAAGASPEATSLAVISALAHDPLMQGSADAMTVGVHAYFAHGGCGDSPYLHDVTASLLAIVNRAA